MELKTTGVAGTLESSDVMVSIAPASSGISLNLESTVISQYGCQIRETVLAVLARLDVKNAAVTVSDHGALDCTIKARVECACYRACQYAPDGPYPWGGQIR